MEYERKLSEKNQQKLFWHQEVNCNTTFSDNTKSNN